MALESSCRKCISPCLFIRNKIDTDGHISIMAESFRPQYRSIQPTLAALAEPISRPPLVHEYHITPFSLGVAVSSGVTPEDTMSFLVENCYELSNVDTASSLLYGNVKRFIDSCMGRYNLVRIVIESDRVLLQCKDEAIASRMRQDPIVRSLLAEPAELKHEVFRWNGEAEQYPFFFLKGRGVCKAVAARCVVIGFPIQQQYDYENDDMIRPALITLRTQTKPRPYQIEAVEAATSDGILNSGCLLLPCGAGKTLLGIMLMCKVKKPTLVICAGSVSVEQWKNQILEYALLDAPAVPSGMGHSSSSPEATKTVRAGAARISCLTGKQKDDIDDDTDVVLTTYSMLVSAHRAHARKLAKQSTAPPVSSASPTAAVGSRPRRQNPKEKLFSPFGLLILDEVHMMPAEGFRESLSLLDAKGIIGLTATYVREDRKILDLFHLVGPKLYDVSMEHLAAQGYLAKVNCLEVHTPMTTEFGIEYMQRCSDWGGARAAGSSGGVRVPALVMLAAANPNKIMCVQDLVHRHLESGDKILVFCDHIMLLYEYGRVLNAPVISGKTLHKDRLMIFSDFQGTSKVNVICVSRVGDVSVNLPSASVVIQVSSHGGSRRQEAQRLGRILRPKDRAANGKVVEAWFYSIISQDTLEVVHAAHRTSFLVDQGYTCRLVRYNPTGLFDAINQDENSHLLAAPASSPRLAAVKVKEDAVGDIASIKQEALHAPWSSPTSPGNHRSFSAEVRSLNYQLHLLSKVISNWEMEYQRQSRKRKHDDEGSSSADEDTSGAAGGEADVVIVEPDRTYSDIKREWVDRRGDGGGTTSATAVELTELVGVNDGFVYHEL